MELVVPEQQQLAILPQHVKNHPTTMTDATEPTTEDIVVARVLVVSIQQKPVVRWVMAVSVF